MAVNTSSLLNAHPSALLSTDGIQTPTIVEEISWKSLAEAKAGCLSLAASPESANALKRLSIFGPAIGLNGCQPSKEEKEDIEFVLSTTKKLPHLVELTLFDSPYTWIPQAWLESKLDKLVVHDPDESVDALIASQPSIRHLGLWSLQNPMDWSEPAPPNVLPALEHVEGYPAVIQRYVPGHPVKTVRVPTRTNLASVNKIVEVAHQSTVKVTTLDVAIQERERKTAVQMILARMGDHLVSLRVCYYQGKRIDSEEEMHILLNDWASGLSKGTKLRSFSIVLWVNENPERGDDAVVRRLGDACPSLETIQFRGETWHLEGNVWAVRT